MDQEQQRQLMYQQMLRNQNPLMGQQMLNPSLGLGGGQFFGQQSLQNPNQLNPGQVSSQHGQHTQQPGGAGALGQTGFQQTLPGGQINPLFSQNPNAIFQQHQQLQPGVVQGQTGQHHGQINGVGAALQKPQVQSGLIPGQVSQPQNQHLLGGAQSGILGQMAAGLGGGQGSQAGNPLLLGNMMQLQQQFQQHQMQQQQQSQQQPNQQQPQQLSGFANTQGLGQLPFQQLGQQMGAGHNIAAYLNKFQDMQAQSNQPNTQDSTGLKPSAGMPGNLYSNLPGQNQLNKGQHQESTNAQSTQNQPSLNPNTTNVHQLNFLGQLNQPGSNQALGQNPNQLNSQLQFFGQNFPNQLQSQHQLGGLSTQNSTQTLQGSTQQLQNQLKPGGLGQLPGQLGQLQNNQGGIMQQQMQQNQNQPGAGGVNLAQNQLQQQLLQNNQQIPSLNPQNNRQGINMQGTGLAGAAMQAEKNMQMQQPNGQGGAPSQGQNTTPNLQGLQPGQNPQMMNVANLNKLAEYCATNGEYQHAIEYYLQLTNLDPDNGPAWTALGHCYLLIEDLQKSFNAYQHALYSLEDIKDPQLWYGIGILYEKFESYDHAISALIAVLKMSPNFYQKSEVLYKLGIIFAKTNQIEQAISYFQNSILTNTFTVKRKVDTLLKIGLLYEENKDFNQAQRSYEAAQNHDDNNYKIYQHLAWSYFLQGNINTAIEFIKKAEKKNKGQADSFYVLGRCFMCLENTKEALENFQQAAYKNPGEAVYWATLAIFYYNTANYTDAFENIIKATTLNPQMSEIWYNLGVLYEKCRQPEEALIAYSKVLEADNDDQDAQKRIMTIKNPQYQLDQQKNQFNLQMKYPKFTLPNSLMILRKYKKSNPNQRPVTTGNEQLQNPLESQLNQQTLGQMPGLQNQPTIQLSQIRPQEMTPQMLGGQGLQNQLDQNKLGFPQNQQQFQGQQQKTEDSSSQQNTANFGGFSAFNPPQGLQNQSKLQGGGLSGLPNPENMVNKLSEIHSILKPPGIGGLPLSNTPNQNLLGGLGNQLQGNLAQGGSNQMPSLAGISNQNQAMQQLNQQQPGMQMQTPNLPGMGQAQQQQNMFGQTQQDVNQLNQQQQQSAQDSNMINIQKTNLSQILQSLPQNVNLNLANLSREDLLTLLQEQQVTQKANEAQVNQIIQQQNLLKQQAAAMELQGNDNSAQKLQEESKNDITPQNQTQQVDAQQTQDQATALQQEQQNLLAQAQLQNNTSQQSLPQIQTPQLQGFPDQNLLQQQQQNQNTQPQIQPKLEDTQQSINDLMAQQQKMLAQSSLGLLPQTIQGGVVGAQQLQNAHSIQNLKQLYNQAFLNQLQQQQLQQNPELTQNILLQQQAQQLQQQQMEIQQHIALTAAQQLQAQIQNTQQPNNQVPGMIQQTEDKTNGIQATQIDGLAGTNMNGSIISQANLLSQLQAAQQQAADHQLQQQQTQAAMQDQVEQLKQQLEQAKDVTLQIQTNGSNNQPDQQVALEEAPAQDSNKAEEIQAASTNADSNQQQQ